MKRSCTRLIARPLITVCGISLLGATGAQAHEIWIEQDAKAARLCFGEFAENLREVSPGLLDKFVQAPATKRVTAQGLTPVELQRAHQAFTIAAKAGKGESLIAEDLDYPVIERRPGEGGNTALTHVFWTPAARYIASLAEQKPELTLDIVPTGKPGEFRVTLKGEPLVSEKVEIQAVSGWTRQATTDTGGIIRPSLPWKGAYVMKVYHIDATPGEHLGAKYDKATYTTTLSFTLPRGLQSPPAPPPAQPNS